MAQRLRREAGPVPQGRARAVRDDERIAFDPAVGKALDGSLANSELSSKTAPAAMIRMLAEGSGGGVQFALTEDALVMGAVLPNG